MPSRPTTRDLAAPRRGGCATTAPSRSTSTSRQGSNSRLDELQAAILSVRLGHLAGVERPPPTLAARYADGLAGTALDLPRRPPAPPCWHVYVVRTPRRDALAAHLGARGVGDADPLPDRPHRQQAFAGDPLGRAAPALGRTAAGRGAVAADRPAPRGGRRRPGDRRPPLGRPHAGRVTALDWKRLGLLDLAAGGAAWTTTHAMLPTPDVPPDGTVASTSRPPTSRASRPYVVEVDPNQPTAPCRRPAARCSSSATPGCFDDNGVVLTSVVHAPDGATLLYYVGFELCHGVRYRLFTGLATSADGGMTFARHATCPCSTAAPPSGSSAAARTSATSTAASACGTSAAATGRTWTASSCRSTTSATRSRPTASWPDAGERIVAADELHEHGLGRPGRPPRRRRVAAAVRARPGRRRLPARRRCP